MKNGSKLSKEIKDLIKMHNDMKFRSGMNEIALAELTDSRNVSDVLIEHGQDQRKSCEWQKFENKRES